MTHREHARDFIEQWQGDWEVNLTPDDKAAELVAELERCLDLTSERVGKMGRPWAEWRDEDVIA